MELLIGGLAAWGLIMLLWTLLGAVLLPLSRRKDMNLTVILRGQGDAPLMERWLRGILWLRDMGLVWWNIVILSDRLDDSALHRARALEEKYDHVCVISTDMLKDWMED